jgi:nicotinamide-nucleotide adenylyltransferase
MVPAFDVLYSGNDFVKHLALAQDPSIEIRRPKFAKKAQFNATNIRQLIVAGKPWKHLVPKAVAKVMENVDGIERIRVLAATTSDSQPQKW